MKIEAQVIEADGHLIEQHQDLFSHIKGNFGEMNWHSTWPMFDADGWQRGLSRKGKREDPDAEAWVRFQNENGIDCAVLYPTSALALGMIQLPAWASALAQGYNDWLYHRFISQTSRLKGVALLAPQDPKSAAAELRGRYTVRPSFTKFMMRLSDWMCLSPSTGESAKISASTGSAVFWRPICWNTRWDCFCRSPI